MSKCSICKREDRAQIELALIRNTALCDLALEFRVGSPMAVAH